MGTIKKILILVLFLLSISSVLAVQPTQQFNKIFLNPFYRASMSANTNYTYSVQITPPDKISSIVNAIVSFNGQINGQTQTFTLFVNGKACNNPTYSVATAFSTTGNVQFSFDCSNVITKAGVYSLNFISAVNTGAMNGWVDLTYMNNPEGKIEVKGTEYYEGDDATLFLKLQDNQGSLIHNATCQVSIYNPKNAYNIHTPLILKAMMPELNQTGLYYYDFITPTLSGLYIADAECSYYTDHVKYYEEDAVVRPIRTIIAGTYTGDSIVLNSISDWLYTQCDSATSGGNKVCDAYYEWTTANSSLFTNLYVNYLGESSGAPTMTFYYYNWTTANWIALPNTLLFHATAGSGVPSGVDEYQSNLITDIKGAVNQTTNAIRIKTTAIAGSTFKLFSNYLVLDASKFSTIAQNLKGSGEVHVSSFTPDTLSGRFYKVTTCDGYTDGRCGTFQPDTLYNLNEGVIEDYVNITAISTRTDAEINYQTGFSVDCSAIYYVKKWNGTGWQELNQGTDYNVYSKPADENCLISLPSSIVAGQTYQYEFEFDNYMKWEVDFSKQIFDSMKDDVNKICLNRGFNYSVPITTASVIPSDNITNFCYRMYDDYYYSDQFYADSQSVDKVGEYASYLQEMRFYRKEMYNRFLFLTLNSNSTPLPYEMWTNPSRNLTYYPNATASVDLSGVPQQVWNYENRTLSYGTGQVGGTEYTLDAQTGRIVARLLDNSGKPVVGGTCNLSIFYPSFPSNNTAYWSDLMSGGGNISGGGQGVYYYDFAVPKTEGVYTYGVDCTYLGQKYFMLGTFHVINAGANSTAQAIWNYPLRNLTYYPPQVDMTNYTQVANVVWSYTGNVTSNILNQIGTTIWDWVTRYTHGEIV